MIDGPGTELPIEFLGAHGPELMDVAGPEMEDVVPGVSVSLLHDYDLCSKQLSLKGRPEPAGSRSDDQNSGALANFPPVVTLLTGLLVQFGPQSLRLPCLEVRLQLGVEEWQLVGFEPEDLTQVPAQ